MPHKRPLSNSPCAGVCKRGFTLIEVMIVVGLVAILSAVAIPSYRDYVVRGNIPEATSRLAGLQVRMEQLYQDTRSYATAGNAGLPCASDTTTSRFFNFDCSVAGTATVFTLRAQGKNSMAGFTYTIDQGSTRTSTIAAPAPTGWLGTQANCWIVKKSAQC